jgi:hypothetical protein
VHMPEFGHDVMVVAGNAPIGYNRANPDKDATQHAEIMVDFTLVWLHDGVCWWWKEGASNMAPLIPAGYI